MAPVAVRDVLPRDGFQDLESFVPTATKIDVIQQLHAAGLRWIECTSLVHPRQLPQFVDAEEVLAAVAALPGIVRSAFVPNSRGLERALAAGVDEVSLAVASTDALSRSNFRRARDEMLEEVLAVASRARAVGRTVSVTVGGAFGCPFEGPVAADVVLGLVDAIAADGTDSVLLADTIAAATADAVSDLVAQVVHRQPDLDVGVHLHGGAGSVQGVLRAVERGARIIDAATGGFGGCPFVPDAPGNVPTELVVAALEAAGTHTGLEPAALEDCARRVESTLKGARA